MAKIRGEGVEPTEEALPTGTTRAFARTRDRTPHPSTSLPENAQARPPARNTSRDSAERQSFSHVLPALIFVVALTGCGSEELSKVPANGGTIASPETPVSTIAAKLMLPYGLLADTANRNAPTQFSAAGQTPSQCVTLIGWNLVCRDFNYGVTVVRGAIAIGKGGVPGTVRIAVPLTVNGWGGLAGGVARRLGLDHINFSGNIDAYVDVTGQVGPDWCPKLEGTVGYTWRMPAQVQVYAGLLVPVGSLVTLLLDSQMAKLKTALEGIVNCAQAKERIANLWTARSYPITLPTKGIAYFNGDPIGMSVGDVIATDTALELPIQVKARVSGEWTPIDALPRPLPPLEHVAPGPTHITLAIRSSYEPLTQAIAGQIKGKSFPHNTFAGKVTVTIYDVTVYPSNKGLVVGATFKAEAPMTFLDVSGQVYLRGKPTVKDGGLAIELKDVHFARILDNRFWTVLTGVFEGLINRQIASGAIVDLVAPLAEARKALIGSLDQLRAQSGARINLVDPKITIARIVPGAKELVVEVVIETTATAVIETLQW